MIRRLLCTVALTVVWMGSAVSPASAAPIVPDQWYTFVFGEIGSALTDGTGATSGTNPPGGAPVLYAPATPWEITTTSANQVLVVVDGFLSTDQFQLFDSSSSMGLTSVPTAGGTCGSDISCALASAGPGVYSQGTFALATGAHSFTGVVTQGEAGAGFFAVTSPRAVPEPGTFALLGTGLLGLIGARRRRKTI